MRRLLILLALVCASMLTIGVANASAANCTFSTSYSVGQPNPPHLDRIFYQVNAQNCTGVSAVRWLSGAQAGIYPGWRDNTAAAWAQGYPCSTSGIGACGPSFGNPNFTVTSSCTNICSAVYWQNMWWFQHATRSVTSRYYVQIKNSATSTWGSVVTPVGITNNVTSSV